MGQGVKVSGMSVGLGIGVSDGITSCTVIVKVTIGDVSGRFVGVRESPGRLYSQNATIRITISAAAMIPRIVQVSQEKGFLVGVVSS